VKIGIIGSGNVGGTLGTRWAHSGHTVVFSSRNPDSPEVREIVGKAGKSARSAPVADAVAASDILLLATPWPVTTDVVRNLGDLHDKILIDATNPLLPDLSGLTDGNMTSGAEQVFAAATNGRVVKAFNTVGSNVMADPTFGRDRAVMFYCGDDADAKRTVHTLAAQLGFEAINAGPLTQARVLEPFALLWISLALVHGQGREMAFKLMRR
jgi:8-hydroxy-5-deazaflavin:NADPH oxidoreductase